MNQIEQRAVHINSYSVTAFSIDMMFDELKLATGTCFFKKKNEVTYLITNRHNVTGKHNETGKHLNSKTLAEPNQLSIRLLKNNNIDWGNLSIKLYDEDGKALWIEHPTFKGEIDVVALPCIIPDDYTIIPIDEAAEPHNEQTTYEVGDDVFILGFPHGIDAGNLPVWKRAFIASEPEIDIGGYPKLLVDTASRPGMSGSPVIVKRRRPVSIGRSDKEHDMIVESRNYNKFIGIYSGRLFSNEKNDAQIGIVWKAELIDEIINFAENKG